MNHPSERLCFLVFLSIPLPGEEFSWSNRTSLYSQPKFFHSRSNYCVTPAFSQAEIFALRETKAIALAILSDHLGPRILASVAQTVRKQWPLARILIHGRPASVLEDHLYDEEMSRSSDPKKLIEDVETLYTGSWNQRSHTLDWDVKRSGPGAGRSLVRESDPTKFSTLNTIDAALSRDTPSGIRYRPR